MLVAEEVYRVVLGDADQRETESERNSVHGAEQRADRREAGEPRGHERQQSEQQDGQAAVGHEQQDHDADDDKSRRGALLACCTRRPARSRACTSRRW